MKIERTHQNSNDSYNFKIDDSIALEIGDTAVSTLGIELPSSGSMDEYYDAVEKQFDIEKMVSDILNKNKVSKIVIDSEVCRADGEIVLQTSDLEKYKK
ncbi:MAG: hypothetical protein A3C63_02065 [Candidatus Zambryskibacteria bacterium RIFCSPHIGHO2_02_FULL_39_82]|nr:MAG: hypothetical protein A3C63_02065 [Candidatus Zambryskibacteria bacterium RIFCSPHIGHO2_02_FULL_39_82]